jgi:sarcosine oxidase subunit gamma
VPTIDPTRRLRRSLLHHVLRASGAEFGEIADTTVAIRFPDSLMPDRTLADAVGLADLGPLPRTGFKGRGAPAWLAAQGLDLPARPNLSSRQGDGSLVARLSAEEHLVLGDLAARGKTCSRLDAAWSLDAAPGCYQMPRRDGLFWLVLAGSHAPGTLAKLCAVDLCPGRFADGAVAQTSIARMDAIVIRADLAAVTAYHLLGDGASAEFLWTCLLDAMAEFGGGPVGLPALLATMD